MLILVLCCHKYSNWRSNIHRCFPLLLYPVISWKSLEDSILCYDTFLTHIFMNRIWQISTKVLLMLIKIWLGILAKNILFLNSIQRESQLYFSMHHISGCDGRFSLSIRKGGIKSLNQSYLRPFISCKVKVCNSYVSDISFHIWKSLGKLHPFLKIGK